MIITSHFEFQVLLGIALLQEYDVPFTTHILCGAALLHSLALPLCLMIGSTELRKDLFAMFMKDKEPGTMTGSCMCDALLGISHHVLMRLGHENYFPISVL